MRGSHPGLNLSGCITEAAAAAFVMQEKKTLAHRAKALAE